LWDDIKTLRFNMDKALVSTRVIQYKNNDSKIKKAFGYSWYGLSEEMVDGYLTQYSPNWNRYKVNKSQYDSTKLNSFKFTRVINDKQTMVRTGRYLITINKIILDEEVLIQLKGMNTKVSTLINNLLVSHLSLNSCLIEFS
jgi:hypothetical protein